jgi:hypothetical protein
MDWTLDLYRSTLSFGSGYDGIPEAIASARSRRSQSGDGGYIGEDGIREDGPDRADGKVVAKALERIAPGRGAAASQTYAARR